MKASGQNREALVAAENVERRERLRKFRPDLESQFVQSFPAQRSHPHDKGVPPTTSDRAWPPDGERRSGRQQRRHWRDR